MNKQEHIQRLLTELCQEALAEQSDGDAPATRFTRAPKGKTIAQEQTTIYLSQQGVDLIRQVMAELRKDYGIRTRLSPREVEQEIVTAMFQGKEGLEHDYFDADALTEEPIEQLRKGLETWIVYLPIVGLELPEGQSLKLAGGTFKSLTENEKTNLWMNPFHSCRIVSGLPPKPESPESQR